MRPEENCAQSLCCFVFKKRLCHHKIKSGLEGKTRSVFKMQNFCMYKYDFTTNKYHIFTCKGIIFLCINLIFSLTNSIFKHKIHIFLCINVIFFNIKYNIYTFNDIFMYKCDIFQLYIIAVVIFLILSVTFIFPACWLFFLQRIPAIANKCPISQKLSVHNAVIILITNHYHKITSLCTDTFW